ncbi:uncharacterized protein LY79DRAFT_76798 [Colletotrichum navitas]|uniref:Secreted protein n=1 Tax=Colletotrichum navitas TaxID=681940 RepID=A0AAD8Q7M2_9PEZI|nr:uncharacterized protein LY79DRAFT_76798 [Colletotrichum navitas]KAK1596069.1 hypothetical protein LY79DRAFT_76798 [Colletotrichum navitas]
MALLQVGVALVAIASSGLAQPLVGPVNVRSLPLYLTKGGRREIGGIPGRSGRKVHRPGDQGMRHLAVRREVSSTVTWLPTSRHHNKASRFSYPLGPFRMSYRGGKDSVGHGLATLV